MRTINITFWMLVVCLFSVQQYGFSQQPVERQNYLPQLLLPSPETAMMNRFDNYPMNLSSGLPDISIPIFEINTGKLKVPITLSYHASGIKVTDEATYVGLGWNLSAGGSISRRIVSKPDEQAGYLNGAYYIRGINSLDPLHNVDDLNYANNVAKGVYDTEPDIFTISLPTANAKFFYADRSKDKPVFIPYSPYLLNTTVNPSQLNFNLKDESGIQYILGTSQEVTMPGSSANSAVSAWNLSYMISPDKTDTVSFNYYTNGYSSGGGDYYDAITVMDRVQNTGVTSCGNEGNCNTCQGSIVATGGGGQSTLVGSNVPQTIYFPGGKVEFTLSATNRLDADNKSLSNIDVYRQNAKGAGYTLLKSMSFFYSYYSSSTDKRLKLDSVQLKDQSATAIQTYSFVYNQSITIPKKTSRGRDYWGYYNGKDANTSLIPQMNIDIESGNGPGSTPVTIGSTIANGREPDTAFNQFAMLTRINYPTGGYSELVYETNKYYDEQAHVVKLGGGLRVRERRNFDPVANVLNKRTYEYGSDGAGNIVVPIQRSFFSTEQFNYYGFDVVTVSKRIRNYVSSPNISFEPFDGNIVAYDSVTEYLGDASVNVGKSLYRYSFTADQFDSWFCFNRPNVSSHQFERGQLLEQIDYKRLTNGTFQKVKRTINNYSAFASTFENDSSLRLFERNVYTRQQVIACPGGGSVIAGYEPYFYSTYGILTGDNRIVSRSEYVYNEDDESKWITSTTSYTYGDTSHYQITKTSTINSKGQTVETYLRYPKNFSAQTVPGKLLSNHQLNTVLEQESLINAVSMNKVHHEYAEWAVGRYYPSYISTSIKSSTPVTEVTFTGYDAQGNPLSYLGRDGIGTCYVWDYFKQYPIAKVIGTSSLADVAYSSFEGDDKGNWTFAGLSLLDPTAPTGRQYYPLTTSKTITKSGLTASKVYSLSYWLKGTSTPLVITGGSGAAGRSANGWTYFEHSVTGVTTLTISGTASIDEVRLYPKSNVQMTTFTYDPLIGVTSQCDANNRISYYEYDGFNRLILVRDQDKNILKQLCYNYAGQPVNCNIYYNTAQTGNFSRTGCTSCQVGSSVTYTVPANTYSSTISQADANSKALADVSNNGQTYANTYGTCTTATAVPMTGGNSITTKSFSVTFTNTCTTLTYNFTVSAGASGVSLSGIPQGTYNVSFTQIGGGTTAYTYRVNSFVQHSISGNITNVSLIPAGNTFSIAQ